MCYIGAQRGSVQNATPPVSAENKMERLIPTQPVYQSIYLQAAVFGLVQFIAMRIELWFVIASGFRASMYSMFGYLSLALITQAIIISLSSIISTYMQLCHQNYHWWWRSFVIGATGSLYIALEIAYQKRLRMFNADWASNGIIMTNATIFLGCYICAAGAIGVCSSYYFVSNLYKNNIKGN